MKHLSLLIIATLLISCNNDYSFSKAQENDFKEVVRSYQSKYMDGAQNCDYIINSMDKNIRMSELRFSEPLKFYTLNELEEFCPHLPKKQIFQTVTEQRLLNSSQGYDFVSQTFLRSNGLDTLRETSSRIWEIKKGVWKIVQMNNSIKKDCD